MIQDFIKFLNEVWREVRPGKGYVTWPAPESIRSSTAVVIMSTIMLSAFIAMADVLLSRLRFWLMG